MLYQKNDHWNQLYLIHFMWFIILKSESRLQLTFFMHHPLDLQLNSLDKDLCDSQPIAKWYPRNLIETLSSSLDKAGLDFRQKAYLRMKTFCKNLYQHEFCTKTIVFRKIISYFPNIFQVRIPSLKVDSPIIMAISI